MMSRLRVNFNKSCLFGLNVDQEEMGVASRFLYCRVGELPFNFLGILVGANPRRASTWKLVVQNMKNNRLSNWRSRQLSIW